MEWVMRLSPGDALVCCVKKVAITCYSGRQYKDLTHIFCLSFLHFRLGGSGYSPTTRVQLIWISPATT